MQVQKAKREDIVMAVDNETEKIVTLTVAECGEFHDFGEFHENIDSVDEAISL